MTGVVAGAREHFRTELERYRTEAKRHGPPLAVLYSPEFERRVPFSRITLPKDGIRFERLPGFAFISIHPDGAMLYFGEDLSPLLKRELLMQASQFYYHEYPERLRKGAL